MSSKFTQDLFYSHQLFRGHGPGRVIIGPDHGPSVDVEQGAAGALGAQCGPLLESAAVCPECERGKQRVPRGSNPRRPAPEEQGMPALTSRLWLANMLIHADTC